MEKLAKAFLEMLLDEQVRRDTFASKGSFAETSVVEFLYRYWLENALFRCGATEVYRERLYPNQKKQIGGGKSCDLVSLLDGKEYWIEMKVAYSNTGYTKPELTSDIEKLSEADVENRLYVVVFICEGDDLPVKLESIIDYLKELGISMCLTEGGIDQPESWHWSHSKLRVLVAEW
ncbi:hypothetical protein NUE03_004317 [Vibrio vulnificus]|nr:hypothetical protein [Vibrio vulnificus]